MSGPAFTSLATRECHRTRADAGLLYSSLGEELLREHGKVGGADEGSTDCSNRFAVMASNFEVPVAYQYVLLTLTCPTEVERASLLFSADPSLDQYSSWRKRAEGCYLQSPMARTPAANNIDN